MRVRIKVLKKHENLRPGLGVMKLSDAEKLEKDKIVEILDKPEKKPETKNKK